MNNKRTFRITQDLKDIDQKPLNIGKVKQLDGTRIVATLLNFGEPMDLSDCLIRMFIKRPDGTELYQKDHVLIDNPNKVTIECVDEIFELNGDVLLEIEVIDLDGYIETMPTVTITVVDKINDDTQREIIRIEEVSMLEELKGYIESSTMYIESFKDALDQFADPDYNSLLDALAETKQAIESMAPQIDEQYKKLSDALEEVSQKEIDFSNKEEERSKQETERQIDESNRQTREVARQQSEEVRISSELSRASNEEYRIISETKREESEGLRANYEETRKSNEASREKNEFNRNKDEQNRVLQEETRKQEFIKIKETIQDITDIVDDIPNHGNFNVDIVTKGNIYATLDGKKPTHFGPPTKDAGNILMPYARAIGGFTKDKSGIRTIGMIAKPKDANPDLDITEDQNSDSVFIGTNVSQLYLYSKEKYPTIVSKNEVSPLATQDWVMRLVDGLGLLDKGQDSTPVVTSKNPNDLFDLNVSDAFSNLKGSWSLDEYNSLVRFKEGEVGKFNPLIGFREINEVTYSYTPETSKNLFIGLWRTDSYLYGARIENNTLSVSYFNSQGIRGGAYTLTIREALTPGELITIHYNHLNEIWEFYRFDENKEPILIYQLSKFMMSGFPEFGNGKNVTKNFGVLMTEEGVVNFSDNPTPMSIKEYSNTIGYSF